MGFKSWLRALYLEPEHCAEVVLKRKILLSQVYFCDFSNKLLQRWLTGAIPPRCCLKVSSQPTPSETTRWLMRHLRNFCQWWIPNEPNVVWPSRICHVCYWIHGLPRKLDCRLGIHEH